MTTVNVVSPSSETSEEARTVELPDSIFAAQVNVPLMHQVVVAQRAAARQGTHATKTRGMVSGGGRKPYRQKGTGRARQGSIRSPQFTGGGVAHGPQPRSYAQRTPKKMKVAALRGALSDRAANGRVYVVTNFVEGDVPKTREALTVLSKVTDGATRNILVVTLHDDEITWKSLRNVPEVHLLAEDQLNTYDVLVSDHVVFTEAALSALAERGSQCSRQYNPRDILLRPVVSEKSYGLLDEGKYTFVVAPGANKTQIKMAVEEVFRVKVTGVNTLNRQGKRRRTRQGWGKRVDTKRAIVTLAEGDRIDIFGGPVS